MSPKNLSISNYLLYNEAGQRGYQLEIIDKLTLILEKVNRSVFVWGTKTSLQSAVGSEIADYKNLTKKFLARYNLPTARYLVIRNPEDSQKLSELTFPIAIKPTDGAHGDDVYVDIKTIEEAEIIATKLINKRGQVLVEEMLVGQEYRVTCVDYKPVAVTMRKPAFVTGDGQKTIKELIDKKNSNPMRGEELAYNTPYVKIKIDDFLFECLQEQELTLESVLPKGQEAYLRKNSNVSTGGEPYNVTETVCQENMELFERITRVCDLNTSGIDIICSDITKPILEQENAGVVEINASPAISTPMFPMKGRPVDVAALIMDMIDRELFG